MKNVCAALIVNDGKVMICQKKDKDRLWEFPGGKQEEGESLEACLEREIREELELEIKAENYLGKEENDDWSLHFFLCRPVSNDPDTISPQPVLKEHADFCWIGPEDLKDPEKEYKFTSLDEAFIQHVKSKRIFIALEPEESVKKQLLACQETWKDAGIRGNYTKEANLHLTLAFIGQSEMWPQAIQVVKNLSWKPEILEICGAGHFKNLWFAAIGPNESLSTNAAGVRQALKQAGIPFDEKPFKAHITMLRKAMIPPEVKPEVPVMPCLCSRVVLYESVFEKGGVRYVPLCGLIIS